MRLTSAIHLLLAVPVAASSIAEQIALRGSKSEKVKSISTESSLKKVRSERDTSDTIINAMTEESKEMNMPGGAGETNMSMRLNIGDLGEKGKHKPVDKEAFRAQKEAERETELAEKEAHRAAEKAQKEAAREAELAEKEAQREAEKAEREAERAKHKANHAIKLAKQTYAEMEDAT